MNLPPVRFIKSRLWLRLTVFVGLLAIVPGIVVGLLAVRAAIESEEGLQRQALTNETLLTRAAVESWLDEQAQSASVWIQVFSRGVKTEAGMQQLARAAYNGLRSASAVTLRSTTLEQPVTVYQSPSGAGAGGRVGLTEAEVGWFSTETERLTSLVSPEEPILEIADSGVRKYLLLGVTTGDLTLTGVMDMTPLLAVLKQMGSAGLHIEDGGQGEISIGEMADLSVLGDHHGRVNTPAGLQVWRANGIQVIRAPLDRAGWTVSLFSDRAPTIRKEILMGTLGVTSFMLLVSAMLGLALRREFTRPIYQLREQVRAVALGAFGQVLDSKRPDELGDLSRAIDAMSMSLQAKDIAIKAQSAKISGFNRELTQRIEERTLELQEAQEQLVQVGQFQAIAEVGAGLAHELNNPIAAILGYLQVTKAKTESPSPLLLRVEQEALRCREVVSTMQRFTDGFLDDGAWEKVDACTQVRRFAALSMPNFASRKVELETLGLDTPYFIRTDKPLFDQLVGRCFEVMCLGLSEGERLSVRLDRSKDTLEFSASAPVGTGAAKDDWEAASVQLWIAKRIASMLRAHFGPQPHGGGRVWVLSFTEGGR